MLIFVIAVGAVMLPILLGGVLALGTSRLDTVVTNAKEEVENQGKGYNPALTLGHKIKVGLEPEAQLKEARLLAAQKAASLPRGSNMRIGRLGQSTLKTAGKALNDDPWTTVKIAQFHGFDGAKLGTGAAAAAPAAVGVAAGTAVAAPSGKIKLVPGKDYEHVAVTTSMSGAEKRQARIANAKAKSKAYKAAKAAREAAGGVPVAAAVAAPVAAAPVAAAAPAMPTGIPEPSYIDITDDMSPDELRKARIHNSKEKSKYNKALKAAGYDPSAVEAGEVVVPAAAAVPVAAAPVAAPAPAAAAPSGAPDPALLASVPAPDYIEVTDSMSPDEIRQARIHNSKARSAYNKALKAAGIDPKSVE
ncbi:MAG: hypothetical protein H6658_06945 [Ardenticatenaceae bacterium]|nr:hypothetical protein [Ardenticatenaceae bacterium]